MASRRTNTCGLTLTLLWMLAAWPVTAQDRVLLEDGFADREIGKPPTGWQVFTDEGNAAVVAERPDGALGAGRCLHI